MAAKFTSPPGWPTPPEGWTPPPGWTPDPSWPPAPEGWQFWTDDAAATPPGGPEHDPHATQTMGTSPTQVLPTSGGPGLYSYGPSTGLDQPGASPYGGSQHGAPPSYTPPGGGPYASPGGPTPGKRNTGLIVGLVVVAALVLGGIAWGISSLLSGGDDPDPTATTQTSDPATTDPATTDDPTDPATTDEPTDPATTDEPTDPATTDAGADGVVNLTGEEPALATGSVATEPIAEIRLQQVVTGWQPSANSMFCPDPENGQYLGLEFEITTTEALAEEDPPTYTFIGWEIGAEVDGVAIETSGFGSGIFCLESDQQFPSEMEPGQTATGWVVLDVPETVTAVTYENLFDWTGEADSYRWVLADQ
jgi:hypothetical protein